MTRTPTTVAGIVEAIGEVEDGTPITKTEMEAVASLLPAVKRMWEAELAAPKPAMTEAEKARIAASREAMRRRRGVR